MIILGVTGSIGSGKSYFCKMLAREKGVVILSSDEEVHRLYNKHLVPHIKRHFPKAVEGNIINRKILGEIVFKDAEKRKQLENIVHPILRKNRAEFLKKVAKQRPKLIIFEIPLLFESGLDAECDYVLTLHCPPSMQKRRVLARPGMTEEKFYNIMKSQMPLAEKLKNSDFSFNTGRSRQFTAVAAKKLYQHLTSD